MNSISLHQLRIASPCTASWDDMVGDDHARFCGECRLNVYNVSAMTQAEAEVLIRQKEGRLCVRLYQRSDGTVMTRDCPIGLAALRRRARWMLARVAASLALVVSGVAWAFNAVHPHRNRGSVTSVQPLQTLKQWLTGPPAPVPMMGTPSPMMGRIAFPSPPAPPTVNGALPRPSEAPAPDCESQ